MTSGDFGIAVSSVEPADRRVSVILSTYNHEDFITQAIESVISQNARVSFELIITEDCSTDGTGDIVNGFAARHPGLIRVLRSPVNLNTNAVTSRAIEQATGEFIALLDGDDYWTDPDKLQRQVAFLDDNRDYSMCFHDCIVVDDAGEVIRRTYLPGRPIPAIGTFRDMARANYIPGPSPMIRRCAVAPLPRWFDTAEVGDWPLYLIAAEHGPIGYIPDRMGAYRRHAGGYWTGMTADLQFRSTLRFLNDFADRAPPSRAPEIDLGIGFAGALLIVNQLRTGNPGAVVRSICSVFGMASGVRRFTLVAMALREIMHLTYRRCIIAPFQEFTGRC